MKKTKVSVAMATYNGEKYIVEQIESILNQTELIDEIIIVDDNSSDKTVDLIKKMNSPLIHLYQNKNNQGYIENFYKAISLTKGSFVFLADQDDVWEKDKVKKTLQVMKSSDSNMAVCTSFSLIDQDSNLITNMEQYRINNFVFKEDKKINDITLKRLVFGNIVQGCTYCLKRQVIEVYLKIHNREVIHDYQLMLISAAMGNVKYLNEPLLKYRLHGNNAVGFAKKKRNIEIPKKISREPFMVRFFKQMSKEIKVPNKILYIILYYFRIPYLISILKTIIYGG